MYSYQRSFLSRGLVLMLLMPVLNFHGDKIFSVPLYDDFDTAEKLFIEGKEEAQYAIQGAEKVTSLNQNELRSLVDAICAADEEKRQEVANNANSRIQSLVNKEFGYFQDHVQEADEKLLDAINQLEKILQDPRYKAKHDKAKSYIEAARQLVSKTDALYRRIENMTRNSRGANHPVTRYMIEEGKTAHKKYEETGPNCSAAEFNIPGVGRCDCIKIGLDGETAYVIEVKPDNSTAISSGKQQVIAYANALNAELKKANSSIIAELIKANSSFNKVKKFVPALKCYRLCPDITVEGDFIKTAVKWTDCF